MATSPNPIRMAKIVTVITKAYFRFDSISYLQLAINKLAETPAAYGVNVTK
ncbi:hypothetical protein VPR01S_03_01980 [Vibrio proteolyticus NBRC 13287]|uniref:Uncharacterized protein n=1 Tax=Vibrio proteolyticus NBRC 13287 TaxID=1219065 RepID=U3BI00_VIBPR|nr:hypothetical protein VPR01S_03_01980 [Vibrio proteolyticus NBRC 13287]